MLESAPQTFWKTIGIRRNQEEIVTLLSGKRVVDLTRPLRPGTERFKLNINTFMVEELLPDFPRPEGEWYILQEWEVSSHIGTHVESPHHHIENGADVSQIELGRLMGEAVVLDLRHKGAGEGIALAEMKAAGGDILPSDIALIHTGFDRHYGRPDYDRPYVTHDAVCWLVDRGIASLGIDASGIEKYKAMEQPSHLLLFRHGIPIIEELTNLDQLRQQRVFFVGLPLPIQGADACPIRAIAIEAETPS